MSDAAEKLLREAEQYLVAVMRAAERCGSKFEPFHIETQLLAAIRAYLATPPAPTAATLAAPPGYTDIKDVIAEHEKDPAKRKALEKARVKLTTLAAFEECAGICEAMQVECEECAAHNEHDVCRLPQPDDYATAIRARAASIKEGK